MVMAAELSLSQGSISRGDADRVKKLIARAGLPVKGPALAPDLNPKESCEELGATPGLT